MLSTIVGHFQDVNKSFSYHCFLYGTLLAFILLVIIYLFDRIMVKKLFFSLKSWEIFVYFHLGCYTHNDSAAVFSGLLQMFFVVVGNILRISNRALYLIKRNRLFSFCFLSPGISRMRYTKLTLSCILLTNFTHNINDELIISLKLRQYKHNTMCLKEKDFIEEL